MKIVAPHPGALPASWPEQIRMLLADELRAEHRTVDLGRLSVEEAVALLAQGRLRERQARRAEGARASAAESAADRYREECARYRTIVPYTEEAIANGRRLANALEDIPTADRTELAAPALAQNRAFEERMPGV